MKALFAALILAAVPAVAHAGDTCYQLSADGRSWSKTPELLCVATVKDAAHTLTLKTGMPGSEQEVMTLRLDLTSRVKCIDCNRDTFALSNPSNSTFNALSVKFNGKRDMKTMAEKGTVTVGKTRFFYRSLPTAAATTPPPAATGKSAPAAPATK